MNNFISNVVRPGLLRIKNRKSSFKIFLLVCLSAWSISSNVVASEKSVDILMHDAIVIALNNNPKIKMSQSQYVAMSSRPQQLGALPEPMLMINSVNLPVESFALNETPMTQMQLGISQVLPFPGKLALYEQIAVTEAEASQAKLNLTKLQLVKTVSQLWWQLFYLDKSIQTHQNNINLLEKFIDVVETKYTVGQGLQQDILLANVELAKIEDNKLLTESQRNQAAATFNYLLGRAIDQQVAIPLDVSTNLPAQLDVAMLVEQAMNNRAELHQSRLKISAAESRVNLADKAYYPDFKIAAIYGWRQDETALASFKLSMNLPFNTEKRQDNNRDQRKHEWLASKFQLLDLENAVKEEIHRALSEYSRARKQKTIYEDRIIPQARQVVDAMLAGYQVNKVDFLRLLRSQINLFDLETQYWQSITVANQALAALNFATAKEIVYEH